MCDLGEGFVSRRDKVVIATKVGYSMPHGATLTRKLKPRYFSEQRPLDPSAKPPTSYEIASHERARRSRPC